MKKVSRRDFVRLSGMGAAAAVGSCMSGCGSSPREGNTPLSSPFQLGMASYTFRNFSLDQTLEMTKRLDLSRISLKSFHLPLDSPDDILSEAVQKCDRQGISLYGCGVVYMQNETEVEQAFAYAKAAGMEMIIGVPNYELLNLIEQFVIKTGIKLAIHNHGPEDQLYPSPFRAYELIQSLDPGVGLCLDIGHAVRSGLNLADTARKLFDRLHDVHIKDETAASSKGSPLEVGRGVIDIPVFLKTLIVLGYSGTVSLEYEKDGDDPLPGAAESIGYIRGVLASLQP